MHGFDAAIAADLPVGSGLSSSAALEVASALVMEAISDHALPPRERALLCRAAEVEFVGVPSGIMDQFASTLCRRGHALFLDCRSLETHHIPLGATLAIAVCDTGMARVLAGSAYAQRRQECADAVTALRKAGLKIASLRDLTPDDVPRVERLPEPPRRRRVTGAARDVKADCFSQRRRRARNYSKGGTRDWGLGTRIVRILPEVIAPHQSLVPSP